jgi:thymidylate kinase
MPGEPFQRSLLLSLIGRMLNQLPPGSVALLRPLPSDFDPRRDDVDLLMSETTRAELLNLLATHLGRTERSELRHPSDCRAVVPNAHERVGQSFCIGAQECYPEPFHFRVSQVRREKIRLTLWDLHCESSLQIDLWSEFRQFPNQRSVSIPAEALLALGPAYGSAAVKVLRPDVHFCLLVLHLASKRKSLSSAVTRERLTDAFERLKAWAIDGTHDMSPLLTLAESMLNATTLAQTVVTAAETYLLAQVTSSSPSLAHRISRVLDNTRGELRRWWMKQVPCIAIDGSDGAGKTTLIRSLCRSTDEPMKPVVAKKLYRQSWVYQIVHSTLRYLTGRDRCAVDDQLAAFTTVRAAMRLWCAFAWTLIRDRFARRRTLLLDRSVGSFLIRNRKGQSLAMTPMWSFISRFVPPMTTVLLTVPWSVLQTRKQEMSQSSHEAYQSWLWLLVTRHRPFDVIVFDNTLPSHSAADGLLTMLGLATTSPDGLRRSASVNCESSDPEQEGRPSQQEVAA